MGKYITDGRTELKYELVGDCYLVAGDDEPECRRGVMEKIKAFIELFIRTYGAIESDEAAKTKRSIA